jgi:lysophospholipase L1-like esterase
MTLGGKPKLQLIGLAILAVVSLAVAAFALIPKDRPEAASSYTSVSPSPRTTKIQPTVAFIGDSYTFGTGAQNRLNRWSTQVSASLGWTEENFGKGGTGYVSVSQQCNGPCTNYAGSIKEAKAVKPALVIVAGIRNDASLPADVLDPAIADFYTALRAALPDAKIIAISPIWNAVKPPERVNTIGLEIKAAVESVQGSYLDIGQPLTGHPDFFDVDGVHPNDAGYAALTTAIQASLKESGLSRLRK